MLTFQEYCTNRDNLQEGKLGKIAATVALGGALLSPLATKFQSNDKEPAAITQNISHSDQDRQFLVKLFKTSLDKPSNKGNLFLNGIQDKYHVALSDVEKYFDSAARFVLKGINPKTSYEDKVFFTLCVEYLEELYRKDDAVFDRLMKMGVFNTYLGDGSK